MSAWEQKEDAYRYDDGPEPEERGEPVVHARADVDARTFPCGVDARANVEVGTDADVTCDGCNAELQRREHQRKTVLRASASLVFALGSIGRSHALPVMALRQAVEAKDLDAIGIVSTDVYRFALENFWLGRQHEVADRFILAVNTAGLRRTGGSLQDAFDAIANLQTEEEVPF